MAPRVDSPMTNPLISKESQTKDSGLRIVHPLTSSPDVQTSLFDPLIGRLLDHYEVHGLLGEGAYGRVYRVRDVSENIECVKSTFAYLFNYSKSFNVLN